MKLLKFRSLENEPQQAETQTSEKGVDSVWVILALGGGYLYSGPDE